MTDTDTYVQRLTVTNPLVEPTLRSAIQALQLPSGSRGLDAGCGIGLQALLLAEAVAPAGHVTGLDISPEFLVHAKEIAEKSGLSEQTSFQEGDVNKLPFDDDTFDWVWSVDCVGDVHAPLSDDIRTALISFFRMLWGGATARGITGRLGRIPAPLSTRVTGLYLESSRLLRLFYLFDVLGQGRQLNHYRLEAGRFGRRLQARCWPCETMQLFVLKVVQRLGGP